MTLKPQTRTDKIVVLWIFCTMTFMFFACQKNRDAKPVSQDRIFQKEEKLSRILNRCSRTVIEPYEATGGFQTMDHSPIMGNGNLMITVGSTGNSLTFYMGKTDFWRDKCHEPFNDGWQSSLVLPGYFRLSFPELKNPAFSQTQDFRLSELRTSLSDKEIKIEMRSITPHAADNYVIHEISNNGTTELKVLTETLTEQYRISTNPFEIMAGISENETQVAWVSRKTHMPPLGEKRNWIDNADYPVENPVEFYGSEPFRMWASIGTRVMGKTLQLTIDNSWSYEPLKPDVKTTGEFYIEPGETVFVINKLNHYGLKIHRF